VFDGEFQTEVEKGEYLTQETQSLLPKLSALTFLYRLQIVWLWGFLEDHGNLVLDEINIVSIDRVHCNIQELRTQPNSSCYLFKYNKCPDLPTKLALQSSTVE
jgi:hypothetical protein